MRMGRRKIRVQIDYSPALLYYLIILAGIKIRCGRTHVYHERERVKLQSLLRLLDGFIKSSRAPEVMAVPVARRSTVRVKFDTMLEISQMLVTEKLRLTPDQSAGLSLPTLWLWERTLLATALRTGQGVRKSRLVRRKPGRSSDPSQLLAQSIRCPSSNTLPSSYSS